jgi:hypothetical protein
MESALHKLADLFRQLGLPDDPASIEGFISRIGRYRPGFACPKRRFGR